MRIFREAGLPDGVINFVPGSGSLIGKVALGHRDLAGIHFTGSTKTLTGSGRLSPTRWPGTAHTRAS
jgi:acyl-CoA reductase-like NAD-dependent aldehyde dehydrogenase